MGEVFDLARRLRVVKQRGGAVYVLGNGGSQANAQHLVLHLRNLGYRAFDALADSAWATAQANDSQYALVGRAFLAIATQNDAALVISGSGNSGNVLEFLQAARERKAMTLGILGFGGGFARGGCDHAVVLLQEDYGPVEDVHSAVVHMLNELLQPDVDWR